VFAGSGIPDVRFAYLSTPKFAEYPLWFGGATALVIVKQFYMREKWPNLSITRVAVVMVDVISRTIVWALYHPLFEFMEKLNK
jgi:hypothetical protein